MKTNIKLFLIISILFFSNSKFLFSQITTLDLGPKKTEEKIILKPEPYDSLTNWVTYKRIPDYKRYIGLNIYLPLFNDLDKYGDKYLTIINVLYGDTINKLLSDWGLKDIKPWKEVIYDNCPKGLLDTIPDYKVYSKMGRYYNPEVIFVLRSDTNNESYYCSFDLIKHFILVPYFVKQKLLYENKYLIFDDKVEKEVFYNCELETHGIKCEEVYENDKGVKVAKSKRVRVLRGSKWLCTDVTLLKMSQAYSKEYWESIKNYYGEYKYNSNAYSLFYILKGTNGETIAFSKIKPLEGEFKRIQNDSVYCDLYNNNGFILESDYLKRKIESEMQAKQLVIKQQQEKQIEKQKFEKWREDCINKFGLQNGELISKNKVNIGMTKEMCKYAWGSPLWSDKTTTEIGTYEIWYYWLGYKLHFVNGILKRIDE